VGGDVLFVEATVYTGTGRLIITGQLGDVMKESAQAALSFVRAHIDKLQPSLPENYFQTQDLHIHVPAGAIPKDGPSAGVTMATALASLISGRRVREDTAMTGELTLTGQVLPIGGLKEKALAAQDAGLERVIAPKLNQQDVEDFPPHLLADIEFIWVERIDQVLDQALEPERAARNGRPPADARSRASVSRDGTATRRARAAQAGRKPARTKARSK
jgi:ATP-dependent Lon protease